MRTGMETSEAKECRLEQSLLRLQPPYALAGPARSHGVESMAFYLKALRGLKGPVAADADDWRGGRRLRLKLKLEEQIDRDCSVANLRASHEAGQPNSSQQRRRRPSRKMSDFNSWLDIRAALGSYSATLLFSVVFLEFPLASGEVVQ